MIRHRPHYLLGAAVVAALLAGCTANPPPPIARATTSPRPTTATPPKNTVVVAIDEIGPGFNPHLVADLSPTDVAVSSMVLPSPFRPAPDPAHPGATLWLPDHTVLVSAAVTSQNPFTITYRLRDDAQWSDGAPIAAEDFHYLWQQMITQEGVVDPAGYRMIADVSSSGGGKVVTVTMKAPYPAWPQLFSNLLPSHLIKDAPGGFERAMQKGSSISGAQFHIKYVDPDRDEILLDRNDRFWDQPAKPDQILLRRGGTPDQLANSLRTDDAQLAQVHGGDATRMELAAVPGVRTGTAIQPRELQLALNGRFGDLVDGRVRAGVLALLDPHLLAVVGQDTAAPTNLAQAQVLSPSDPGYAPTAPPRPSVEDAYAELAAAGYLRTSSSDGSSPARLLKDGKPLSIRIGVAETDHKAVAVANSAADQLRGAGVDASVRTMPANDLYGPALVGGSGADVVDAVVGWVAAGGDPATALASRFGCPPVVAAPTPAASTALSATPTTPEREADPAARAPSNLSGVCDPTLQTEIDAALRGQADVGKTIADLEPRLWALSTVLPIMQDTTVVAAGNGVRGASLSGAIEAGPFADAGGWTRSAS